MDAIDIRYESFNEAIRFHHIREMPKTHQHLTKFETHNCFELYYLKEGNVKFIVETTEYSLTAGDILLLKDYELHSLFIDAQSNYDRYVVQFCTAALSPHEKLMNAFADFILYGNRLIPAKTAEKYDFTRYFLTMEELCGEQPLPSTDRNQNPSSRDILLFARFSATLLLMMSDFLMHNPDTSQVQSNVNELSPLVNRAVQYINDTITEPFSLTKMAANLFVSQSYLSHEFTQKMHLSTKKYVLIKKIIYAHSLIESGMPAMQAASSVGFSSYSSFFYNYMNIIGSIPSKTGTSTSIEYYRQIINKDNNSAVQKTNPYKIQHIIDRSKT